MMDRNDDPGIPTLTQRAPSRHEPPVLTQQADERPPWDAPAGVDQHAESVLRAALQADIEDAVQDAVEEAMHLVRARLEARIPEIVAQAVKRTRVG